MGETSATAGLTGASTAAVKKVLQCHHFKFSSALHLLRFSIIRRSVLCIAQSCFVINPFERSSCLWQAS
jgi:hypothetical protein